MNTSDIRKLNTFSKWETIGTADPAVQTFAEKSSFGKSQGAELYLRGYEKGINDAQTQKTPSSAASR